MNLSAVSHRSFFPDCRKTMPWSAIEAGVFAPHQKITKALIALRKADPQLREDGICWHHDERYPRLICYDRPDKEQTIRVYLNNTEEDIMLQAEPLFAHKYENGYLKANGIVICTL